MTPGVRLLLYAASGSPPPITRDGAQRGARDELSKRAYHAHDPSTLQRIFDWLMRKLSDAIDAAARHSPGNGIGLLVIVVVLAAAIAFVTIRVGRIRRTAKAAQPILGSIVEAPDDHRRRAAEFAVEQLWAQAVREWFRAVVRELEQRDVIDVRPSRTAAELCAETSKALPLLAQDLRRAAAAFDAIWYGGRAATAADEEFLRALDRRVAGSHRSLTAAST
ncbi:MAG: DUF4129 domain-containing protein [Acidothermaceae bacterium]